MFSGLKKVPPTDGVGITSSMLATIGSVSALPSGARTLAQVVAPALPALVAAGQRTHDALVAALAERDGAVIRRGGGVEATLAAEEEADKAVGALARRLDGLVTEGVEGAGALRAYLFPQGTRELTRVRGRPQRARYDTWRGTWAGRPKQGSAADVDIAASLANVASKLDRFAEVLDGKDAVSRAADEAVDQREETHEAWLAAWEDLIDAVQLVQASDPEAFTAWMSPYAEWKQAQASRARRGRTEEAVGDDGVDVETGADAADPHLPGA